MKYTKDTANTIKSILLNIYLQKTLTQLPPPIARGEHHIITNSDEKSIQQINLGGFIYGRIIRKK